MKYFTGPFNGKRASCYNVIPLSRYPVILLSCYREEVEGCFRGGLT